MSQQQKKNVPDHPHFHIVSSSHRVAPYGILCTSFVVLVADIAVEVGREKINFQTGKKYQSQPSEQSAAWVVIALNMASFQTSKEKTSEDQKYVSHESNRPIYIDD